jgi:hypothetical protein
MNRLEKSIYDALIADEGMPPQELGFEEATAWDARVAAAVARQDLRRRDSRWGAVLFGVVAVSLTGLAWYTPTQTVVTEKVVTLKKPPASCIKALDDLDLLLSYVTDALSEVDKMNAAQAAAQQAVIARDKAALDEAWAAMDEVDKQVSVLTAQGQSVGIGVAADECRSGR